MKRPMTADRRPTEAGQSLLWFTIVMLFVGVPLMVLVVDGIQFWRVRNQLQVAADAACEEAAYVGADRRAYRENGVQLFGDTGTASADARQTFYATLFNADVLQYGPTLSIAFDNGAGSAICNASANVQSLIASIIPAITIDVEAESEMRFSSR